MESCEINSDLLKTMIPSFAKSDGTSDETSKKGLLHSTPALHPSKSKVTIQEKLLCPNVWTYRNAFFFTGTIGTTIGYGNVYPSTYHGKLFCIFYALTAIPIFGYVNYRVAGRVFNHFMKCSLSISTNTLVPGFLKAKYNLAKKTIFGSRPTQHQTVSIFGFYLSFGIISLFLVPAYGFHYLEGWSYADSIYFTVISLTTIGFGDFSPSFEGSEETGIPFMAVYRILVLFWMMIGSGIRGTI